MSGSGTIGSSSATVNVSGGTLDLGATSSTVGAVTVSGGAVQNGTLTGTSFALQGGTVSAALNGAGAALTKTAAGTATLSGNNGYTGGTTISAGTLTIAGAGTLGGGNYSGAIGDSGTFNYGSSANQNLSGVISGTGALTLTGGGTLTLSAANTYSGATTVSAGTLKYGVANAIPSGSGKGDLIINENGTVDLNGFTSFQGYTSQGINGLGGSGTLDNSSATAATLGVGNNDVSITFSGTIKNSGAAGGINLVKEGTGTLTLAGTNTFSGYVGVYGGGTLSVSSISNALGSVSSINLGGLQANGTLLYTGPGEASDRVISYGSFSGSAYQPNQIIDQSGTGLLKFTANLSQGGSVTHYLTLQGSTGGSGEIAGSISSSGGVTTVVKAGTGTWTLSGANAFTGGIIVSNGQLNVTAANTYSGATTIRGGKLVVNGSLASASTVTVEGGTLSGSGTIGGTVAVNAGGALTVGGSAGTPGTLTINNSLALNGSTTLRINKGSTGDLIQAASGAPNLTSGGTLNIYNVGGALAGGDSFTLFSGFTFGGTAPAAGTLPALDAGLNWYLGSIPVDGKLIINQAPTAGAIAMGVGQGDSATLTIIGGKHAPADADGDTLSVSLPASTSGNGASLSTDGAKVTVNYSGVLSFSGPDTFDYTVTDGRGGSVTKTVTVSVYPASSGANIVSGSLNVNGGVATMKAFGIPGANYHLQYTTSLSPVNWQDVNGAHVTASGVGSMTLTDSGASGPMRVYRCRYVSGP